MVFGLGWTFLTVMSFPSCVICHLVCKVIYVFQWVLQLTSGIFKPFIPLKEAKYEYMWTITPLCSHCVLPIFGSRLSSLYSLDGTQPDRTHLGPFLAYRPAGWPKEIWLSCWWAYLSTADFSYCSLIQFWDWDDHVLIACLTCISLIVVLGVLPVAPTWLLR